MSPPLFADINHRGPRARRDVLFEAMRSLGPGGECLVRGIRLDYASSMTSCVNAWNGRREYAARQRGDDILLTREHAPIEEQPPVQLDGSGSIITAIVGFFCLFAACCIMAIAYIMSIGGGQ